MEIGKVIGIKQALRTGMSFSALSVTKYVYLRCWKAGVALPLYGVYTIAYWRVTKELPQVQLRMPLGLQCVSVPPLARLCIEIDSMCHITKNMQNKCICTYSLKSGAGGCWLRAIVLSANNLLESILECFSSVLIWFNGCLHSCCLASRIRTEKMFARSQPPRSIKKY